MGFHWGTFFAQIINLFVLVWLMKRFLYRPIVDVIAKRQAYIEGKVKNAEAAERAAQKQQRELQHQTDRWQKDKKKRMEALYAELDDLRREQSEHIRSEGVSLRQKMQDDLNRETASLQLEIRDMMARNFLEMSRKVLSDFSELTPMAQAVSLFQKKISDLPRPALNALQKTIKKTGKIVIETSAELDPKTQKSLTLFLREKLGITGVQFAVNPDLILGVETIVGETVLEWSLRNYLDTFEGHLNTALAGLIVKE